jgi:hypothetical protein
LETKDRQLAALSVRLAVLEHEIRTANAEGLRSLARK